MSRREIQFRDVAGNEWDITLYQETAGPGYGLATLWQGTTPVISVHIDEPPTIEAPLPVRRLELKLGRTLINITRESATRITNFFNLDQTAA